MACTWDTADYFPAQDVVERIVLDDKGKLKPDKNTLQLIQLAEQAGQTQVLEPLRGQTVSHPQKDRSFHYLPCRTGSGFEQTFLREALPLPKVERFEYLYLEDTMTDKERILTTHEKLCEFLGRD